MSGPKGKILVVDDEAVVLECCRRILAEEGYLPVVVSGVREGLDRLREGGFRLVIADVWMPEQDGLSFLAQVSRSHPGLPILIFSGFPTEELVSRSLSLKAAGFLAKPFTPEELLAAVRRAL